MYKDTVRTRAELTEAMVNLLGQDTTRLRGGEAVLGVDARYSLGVTAVIGPLERSAGGVYVSPTVRFGGARGRWLVDGWPRDASGELIPLAPADVVELVAGPIARREVEERAEPIRQRRREAEREARLEAIARKNSTCPWPMSALLQPPVDRGNLVPFDVSDLYDD